MCQGICNIKAQHFKRFNKEVSNIRYWESRETLLLGLQTNAQKGNIIKQIGEWCVSRLFLILTI